MSRKAFAASDAEWAYHGGEFVKLGDVRLSPATHALNYGTGVFQGIRAYWNPTKGTLQVLKLREHYERFEKSCQMLLVDLPHSVDELCDVTLEILHRNAPREDTYIRPLAYKSVESVGVNLRGGSELSVFTVPMGNYVELTGLKCCVSSWRRTADNAIPARAKCTGSYVNTAVAGGRGKHLLAPQGQSDHTARHGGHPGGDHARRCDGACGEGARDADRQARRGSHRALRCRRGLSDGYRLPDSPRHRDRRSSHRHGRDGSGLGPPAGAVLRGRPWREPGLRRLDRGRRGCGTDRRVRYLPHTWEKPVTSRVPLS